MDAHRPDRTAALPHVPHGSGPGRSPRVALVAAIALLALALAGCASPSAATGSATSSAPIAASSAPVRSTGAPIPPRSVLGLWAAWRTACRPTDVLPFECGTYRSVYGPKQVAGDTGGPAKDPLSISFVRFKDALLLRASDSNCFAATVPVRVLRTGSGRTRLEIAGSPVYGANDCHGPGADKRSWAYAFLNGPLRFDGGMGGLAFNLGAALVTFEYEGVAPIGQRQIARNDQRCVPAHVAPFSCGRYRSVRGTGSLAFLAAHPYRLELGHLNGELTAALTGSCNTLSTPLELEGDMVVALPGAGTAMGCPAALEARDDAVVRFFDGSIGFHIRARTLTLTGPRATAVFTRQ